MSEEFYSVDTHYEDDPETDTNMVFFDKEELLLHFKDTSVLPLLERDDFHWLHFVVGQYEVKVRRHFD